MCCGWPSSSIMEESREIGCNRLWLLSRGEVPAARKDYPALDAVHALQIRARRLALGNGLVRKDTKCRGSCDVGGLDRVPAIVPIIAHRRRDGLRDPVQGERGAEEVVGRRDVAPGVPLLAQVRGQPDRGVVESI